MAFGLLVAGCGGDGGGEPPTGPEPDAGMDGPVDTTPPQLVSSEPADGATDVSPELDVVVLRFDEAVDLYTVAEVPLEVAFEGGSLGAWIEPADGGRELRLHLAERLPEGAAITVRLGPGVADLAGNATTEPFEVGFRTAPGELLVHPARIVGPPGHVERVEALGSSPASALDPSGLVWSSEDEAVATVSGDGTVTLVAAGTTRIRVASDREEAFVEVVVQERVAAGFPPGRDPTYGRCIVYDLNADGSIQDSGCDRLDRSWDLTVDGTRYEPPPGSDGTTPAPELRPPMEGPAPAMVWRDSPGPDGMPGTCQLLARGGAGASQEVDLSGASGATLSFQASSYVQGPDPVTGRAAWKVLLVDASGAETTVVEQDLGTSTGTQPWQPFTADLSAWAGQRVRLRWVVEGAPQNSLWIDDVAVLDEGGTDRFAGGNCEGGLDDAWQVEEALVPREIVFAEMELPDRPGVFVHRRVYTPYFEPYWIRYLDVIENRGTEPVTLTVRHDYELGPVNETTWFPLHGGHVVVGLDGDADDPGIALLLGEGYTGTFEYDEDDVSASWEVTVEPGRRAAILTYGVFLLSATRPTPEDVARIETAYEGLRSGYGPLLSGLDRDDLAEVANWSW